MERSGDTRVVLRLVFAASLASLAYELALMRSFSISLWYHFAFMVISIAMLGIGASGSALFVLPGLKDLRRVPYEALLLAAAIPASYVLANFVPFDPARLSWDRLQLLAIGLYYLILCVPFFCFGLIVSTVYSARPSEAGAVYASDLLGAGAGALAMVWLLSLGGPETSVLVVSSLLAATLLLPPAGGMIRPAALLLIAANLAILLIHPPFFRPAISPYKPFSLALHMPGAERLVTAYGSSGRVDLFRSPAVRFAPGLSFTYRAALPEQLGIAVDAGNIYALTNDADPAALAFVRYLPSSLAYRLNRNRDVLIIEPLSGLAAILARQFGANSVFAIDSNPIVLRALREYGRDHAVPAFERGVRAGLARTWLAASDQSFDLIDISLMGSWPSAAFGFAEDYRFTVEAFEEYLARLKQDGFLSLNLYIIPPPRTELRLLATLARSARNLGITDISRSVAAVRSWDALTVIMKRSPLTGEDIGRIRDFARSMRFDLVYYPGIAPGESNVYIKQPGNEYAEAFRRLVENRDREQFLDNYLFDIRPATDEKPFFHYYLKAGNMPAIYRMMGEKWHYFIEEGYLLPVMFAQVLVVSAVLILLPLLRLKTGKPAAERGGVLPALSYFALLGIAYLFVEVAFIQKMILVLENPSTAASTVIASILISSGAGSLLSRHIRLLRDPRVLLVLGVAVATYSLLLPGVPEALGRYVMSIRIVLAGALVMPIGVLMGLPFPFGIAAVGAAAPRLVPWAWAVNGCFSVVAPILAIMLALSAGYQSVLLCGAAAYGAAYLLVRGGGVVGASASVDIGDVDAFSAKLLTESVRQDTITPCHGRPASMLPEPFTTSWSAG